MVSPTTGQEQYSGMGGLTKLGIAQQNIAQGQGFQSQASNLSNAMGLVTSVGNKAADWYEQMKINPNAAPFLNAPVQEYLAVANPAAKQTWGIIKGELQSAMSQILQSTGGMTPTDAGSLAAQADPSLLTPTQLREFIANLDTAGQLRLSQYQQSMIGSYGAGTTPYAGQIGNQGATFGATTANVGALNPATTGLETLS